MPIFVCPKAITNLKNSFFVILDHILPFYTPNNPKKSKFWKNEKKAGDIIILHMCTMNDNHMIYGSWDMKRDGQNFLSFWTIFFPFTPIKTRKIKILKKWKKSLKILSFYTSVLKIMIICYTVLEIWSMMDVIVAYEIVALTPPSSSKNQNFKKMKTKCLQISSFHVCVT